MPNQKLSLKPLAAIALAACLLSSCTGGAPTVHFPDRYNRESVEYRKGISDRNEVIVCYSKSGGTPAQVANLAREECGRFGKTAVFREQSYQICPMLTPVAAIFNCVSR